MKPRLPTAAPRPNDDLTKAKAPSARAALALAKAKTYQAAADAPATLRAYQADLANFKAWCEAHGFQAMPSTPETVGAYLAAAGLGYAMPTLRRRVAAIARAHRIAKHPLTRDIRQSGRRCGASPAAMANLPAVLQHWPPKKFDNSWRSVAMIWPGSVTARSF